LGSGGKCREGEASVGWDASEAAALVLFQRRASTEMGMEIGVGQETETEIFREARTTRPVNRRRMVEKGGGGGRGGCHRREEREKRIKSLIIS
jgi:hypothetical protein